MSILRFFAFIVLSVSFFACNPNPAKTYKKDLLTGFTIVSENLAYQDFKIKRDNSPLTNNHIPLGSHLTITISDIQGFRGKKKMVFPGASLKVSGRNGKIIVNQKDLFSNYNKDGIALSDSKFIKLTFQTGSPMAQKQRYLLESTIWDKNGSGIIIINLYFIITEKK